MRGVSVDESAESHLQTRANSPPFLREGNRISADLSASRVRGKHSGCFPKLRCHHYVARYAKRFHLAPEDELIP